MANGAKQGKQEKRDQTTVVVTVDLPVDLHASAKSAAALERITLRAYIINAIERGLKGVAK